MCFIAERIQDDRALGDILVVFVFVFLFVLFFRC